jgi:DNA polymerase (family 10)
MDSRSAAHVLSQIAAYLELAGANRYKARAYQTAARSLLAANIDDLSVTLRSGELARLRGIGPATLAVVRDLVESGESRYLEELRQQMPEGLLDLMRVPGLSNEKILRLHALAGVASIEDLELAARDGRLAKVKGFGPKTAQKILGAIEFMRSARHLSLYPHAIITARAILSAVRSHPDVLQAELAGSLRRVCEVVADIDIVAACERAPDRVAASFGRIPGVADASQHGGGITIRFVDGTLLDLYCVAPDQFGVALWRATGSADHVAEIRLRLEQRGLRVQDDVLIARHGRPAAAATEQALYEAAGMQWIPPELRENQGEADAARTGDLPRLIDASDIRGALHCHSDYSDGKSTIAEIGEAAKAKGWSYAGISDHSQAAFYASGMTRERVLNQHDEIDAYNARNDGPRILKGIEADILADGRLDYDEELLGRFDYVIASIHSRFRMDGAAITERVLRAMDDPHMTILAHPTGRLLLSREPYALDVETVLQKAAAVGVAVELNCDPHRMDLDWRYLKRARDLGVTVEIGPDAHSARSLEWTDLGVAIARKGWLRAEDILNARETADVLAFARKRRA